MPIVLITYSTWRHYKISQLPGLARAPRAALFAVRALVEVGLPELCAAAAAAANVAKFWSWRGFTPAVRTRTWVIIKDFQKRVAEKCLSKKTWRKATIPECIRESYSCTINLKTHPIWLLYILSPKRSVALTTPQKKRTKCLKLVHEVLCGKLFSFF